MWRSGQELAGAGSCLFATFNSASGAAAREAACLGPALRAVRVGISLPESFAAHPCRKEQRMSMKSFPDLGVSDAVTRALAARGINSPFAIQILVIGDVLAGRDVLAKSPTGSGKTLAFAVPLA